MIVSATLEAATQVASLLYAGGVWNLAGVSVADPAGWVASGMDVRTAGALVPDQVVPHVSTGELELIDVRDMNEWRTGHVAGSLHLPLFELGDGAGLWCPISSRWQLRARPGAAPRSPRVSRAAAAILTSRASRAGFRI